MTIREGTRIVHPCFDVCIVSKRVDRWSSGGATYIHTVWWDEHVCLSFGTSESRCHWAHCAGTREVCALDKGTPSSMSYCLRRYETGWVVIPSSTAGNGALHFRTLAFGHQTVGSSSHCGPKSQLQLAEGWPELMNSRKERFAFVCASFSSNV